MTQFEEDTLAYGGILVGQAGVFMIPLACHYLQNKEYLMSILCFLPFVGGIASYMVADWNKGMRSDSCEM